MLATTRHGRELHKKKPGDSSESDFSPFDEWKKDWSEEDAAERWEHIYRSPNASIYKAKRLLNYQPRYAVFAAVYESLIWMIDSGELEI